MQQLIPAMLSGGIITGLLFMIHLKLPSEDRTPLPRKAGCFAANDNFLSKRNDHCVPAEREPSRLIGMRKRPF
jgi:hypothetical protein